VRFVRYLNTAAANDNQLVVIVSRGEQDLTGRSLAHGSIAAEGHHFVVAKYRAGDGVVCGTADSTS